MDGKPFAYTAPVYTQEDLYIQILITSCLPRNTILWLLIASHLATTTSMLLIWEWFMFGYVSEHSWCEWVVSTASAVAKLSSVILLFAFLQNHLTSKGLNPCGQKSLQSYKWTFCSHDSYQKQERTTQKHNMLNTPYCDFCPLGSFLMFVSFFYHFSRIFYCQMCNSCFFWMQLWSSPVVLK